MAECKAAKSPFLSGIKMHEFGNSPLVDIRRYRKLVGILLSVNHTRPDLSYVVSDIEINMHHTHDIHWREEKIIF